MRREGRRIILELTCIVAGAFLLAACNTTIEQSKVQLPQATSTYQPPKFYSGDIDAVWAKVVSALRKNQITIATAMKDVGQLSTDYIAGPAVTKLMLITTIQHSSRYKYSIYLQKIDSGKTQVDVKCIIERTSTTSDGGGTTPFQDVTAYNPSVATSLQNWLYEQIDGAQ